MSAKPGVGPYVWAGPCQWSEACLSEASDGSQVLPLHVQPGLAPQMKQKEGCSCIFLVGWRVVFSLGRGGRRTKAG